MRYNVTTEEISLLKDARNIYSKLVVIERIAMNATDGTFDDGTGTFLRKGKPDSIMAHKILLSEDYTKLNGELSLTVAKLISNIERRYALRIKTEEGVAEHLLAINSYLNLALFSVVISAMIFLRLNWRNRSAKVLSALSEMRDGNLTVRAPIYGNDEVSMMSKAINAMADNLCFALDKLEEKVVLSEKALSALEAERRRSEKLLHNILPAAIAERLGDAFKPHLACGHCQHVADFAIEAGKFIEEYSKELRFPLRMRIGMHTGTVAAGIVGKKRFSYDLWGDVVNVASRYESTSMPDKIHISEAVKVRLDDDYLIVDGGAVDLKGKGLAKSYFLMGKKSEMPQVTPFRKDAFS